MVYISSIYQGTITLSNIDGFEKILDSVDVTATYSTTLVTVYKAINKKGTTVTLSKSMSNSKACLIELG